MSKDFFQHKANSYEQDQDRVNNVENIACSIQQKIKFDSAMDIMDFGSGTGLLLEKIAPFVNRITAIDISKSMNEQLRQKQDKLGCELEVLEMDLTQSTLDRKFDGIISSMTLHHVEDTQAMFNKFKGLLNTGGFIAIADLETEDGSFHTENTGVFHNGFDPQYLIELAQKAGFKDVQISAASTVMKPNRGYPVLLLTGFINQ